MRLIATILYLLATLYANSQQEEDEIKRWQDTLAMGGQQHLNKSMPSFVLKSKDGKQLTPKNLIGKVTFINFWFESCMPCIAGMGALENLYKKFKSNKKFQFVSITYENHERIDTVRKK